MKERKPLFIYDCDGTLQGPPAFVYGAYKAAKLTNLSLQEFKAQCPEKMALYPGMDELVRFTFTKGHNVLISEGWPDEEACKGLKDLRPFFQDWKFNGEDVIWGRTPGRYIKASKEIAEGVLDFFDPSVAFIIADSVDDLHFGQILSFCLKERYRKNQIEAPVPVVAFMRQGISSESCLNSEVPVISVQTGGQMKSIIEGWIKNPKGNKLSHLFEAQKMRAEDLSR